MLRPVAPASLSSALHPRCLSSLPVAAALWAAFRPREAVAAATWFRRPRPKTLLAQVREGEPPRPALRPDLPASCARSPTVREGLSARATRAASPGESFYQDGRLIYLPERPSTVDEGTSTGRANAPTGYASSASGVAILPPVCASWLADRARSATDRSNRQIRFERRFFSWQASGRPLKTVSETRHEAAPRP
jgi:hypothetical protein